MNDESAATSKDPDGVPASPPERKENSEPAGPDGKPAPRPDPTRYGDWEKDGRCIDF
jgi:hypothetical protein